MKTEDILHLALRRGEITSKDVVSELSGDVKKQSDYRALLAQASTLLRRLHKSGRLERRWVANQKGQYVYSPSEKTINPLLPALHVLEERKRRKNIEETLAEFTEEIILRLRMENEVKAILWNPSERRNSAEGLEVKAWIVTSDMKGRGIIERKAKEYEENMKIDPFFLTPKQFITLQNVDSMRILYGWNSIASTRRGK